MLRAVERARAPTTRERPHSHAKKHTQFAQAQKDDNRRYLDIASVFDGSSLKGKRVAITGGSRGLGLEIAKAAMDVGAEVLVICRSGTVDGAKIYDGVDVTDAEACASAAKKIVSDGGPVDVLINNAGYFYGPCEKVTENSLNFEEELKQIDICAVGPLRVSNALYQAGGLVEGSKIAIVTSQAGSCEWRFTQNKDEGGDYGHHMSKSAANMGGVLLAQDGVPFADADGFSDFQKIDPLGARFVEVYKGGNALRFGGAQLGGAINFVTPNGKTAQSPVLARVEAGAQGEHKLARGYAPEPTWSAHYIPNPGFRRAVAGFLTAEREDVQRDRQWLAQRTPFRKGD